MANDIEPAEREPDLAELLGKYFEAQLGQMALWERHILADEAIEVLGRQYSGPTSKDLLGNDVSEYLQTLVMLCLHRGLEFR